VPILLLWIYVGWVIVLLGAVITAYLPSLLSGVERRPRTHGLQFQLALESLQQLERARPTDHKGLTIVQLTQALRVDSLQLEPVLETLCALDWIAPLQEESDEQAPRYVLLANPDTTALAPLLQALLLPGDATNARLWDNARWRLMTLREAL
jgi:membrane protein